MGLALAAGGTAWWSSRRADRAYNRYLHSAGLQRQADQLRRARHYDRVAGAAFVFMETGIVLTTYLVFF
jgi:L,D-peptidoglycan transpeptidase YkuD (ErfK/YbiS/YcfS/YnhG family)